MGSRTSTGFFPALTDSQILVFSATVNQELRVFLNKYLENPDD